MANHKECCSDLSKIRCEQFLDFMKQQHRRNARFFSVDFSAVIDFKLEWNRSSGFVYCEAMDPSLAHDARSMKHSADSSAAGKSVYSFHKFEDFLNFVRFLWCLTDNCIDSTDVQILKASVDIGSFGNKIVKVFSEKELFEIPELD
ncbi:hypothetical protein CDAR_385081 [Caerostris darwini]|uniref:Uncharacterized protein n=1 Tax=Caerostris darwini TaxID=1538125 RepID=A0AAV4WF74_9ARAC|nr:hypothetical protein CDAR_385081 [Caerostris darwini]